MLPRALNLDCTYADGHDGVALPRHHYELLLGLVQNLDWRQDPEGIFGRLPSFLSELDQNAQGDKFAKERMLNEASLRKCPEDILRAANNLLTDSEVMGNWLIAHKPNVRFVSVWDGAEDLDWHWDGPAGADFFFLIYLNRHSGWLASDGGQLKVGKRGLAGNYLQANGDIEEFSSYEPASRTLVCCNNQNPQFVHKVIPLSKGRERTVLMLGFDMIRDSSCNRTL